MITISYHREIRSKPFSEIVQPIIDKAKRSESLIDVTFERAFGDPMLARIAWDTDISELYSKYSGSLREAGPCRTFRSTFGF